MEARAFVQLVKQKLLLFSSVSGQKCCDEIIRKFTLTIVDAPAPRRDILKGGTRVGQHVREIMDWGMPPCPGF